MKQFFFTLCCCITTLLGIGQATEGRIVYENVSQLKIQFAHHSMVNAELQKAIPQNRVRSFELLFGNNRSVWQSLPDARQEAERMTPGEAGGGIVFKTFLSTGKEEMTYVDFSSGRKVVARELNGQKYLVEDTILRHTWQFREEEKKILGFNTQKAVAEIHTTRWVTQMENGAVGRKEVLDTIRVTAWFTKELPVPAGPVYQGQLPGVILELDINNGQGVYKAVEYSPKVSLAKIKEPKGGKKVTSAFYAIESGRALESTLQRISENRGQIQIQQ